MGTIWRKDKKLVLAYLIFLCSKLEPTLPLHAVDEHILGDGLMALAEMAFRMRIVSNVGDMEARHQWVVSLHFYRYLWQYNAAFAGKSIFHTAKVIRKSIISKIFSIFYFRKSDYLCIVNFYKLQSI